MRPRGCAAPHGSGRWPTCRAPAGRRHHRLAIGAHEARDSTQTAANPRSESKKRSLAAEESRALYKAHLAAKPVEGAEFEQRELVAPAAVCGSRANALLEQRQRSERAQPARSAARASMPLHWIDTTGARRLPQHPAACRLPASIKHADGSTSGGGHIMCTRQLVEDEREELRRQRVFQRHGDGKRDSPVYPSRGGDVV